MLHISLIVDIILTKNGDSNGQTLLNYHEQQLKHIHKVAKQRNKKFKATKSRFCFSFLNDDLEVDYLYFLELFYSITFSADGGRNHGDDDVTLPLLPCNADRVVDSLLRRFRRRLKHARPSCVSQCKQEPIIPLLIGSNPTPAQAPVNTSLTLWYPTEAALRDADFGAAISDVELRIGWLRDHLDDSSVVPRDAAASAIRCPLEPRTLGYALWLRRRYHDDGVHTSPNGGARGHHSDTSVGRGHISDTSVDRGHNSAGTSRRSSRELRNTLERSAKQYSLANTTATTTTTTTTTAADATLDDTRALETASLVSSYCDSLMGYTELEYRGRTKKRLGHKKCSDNDRFTNRDDICMKYSICFIIIGRASISMIKIHQRMSLNLFKGIIYIDF